MMVYSVGSAIWLCWILLSVTPLVQCQFGNNPFSSSPFGSGGGKSPIGNVFPSPNGGFSGGGFQGGGFNGGFSPVSKGFLFINQNSLSHHNNDHQGRIFLITNAAPRVSDLDKINNLVIRDRERVGRKTKSGKI
jgi:hypothetical protein